MSWKSINFQGIAALDSPLVELLNQHLDERESQLAHKIISAIPLPISEPGAPHPIPIPKVHLKINEAIDAFTKLNYHSTENRAAISKSDFKSTVKQINYALNEHVTMIEGCVTELFKQLDQLGLDQWHMRLSNVVGTIKDTLIHKIEDLIWSIRRLENLLEKCRAATEPSTGFKALLLKSSNLWSSLTDRSLITRLQHSEEHLKSQYEKFIQRYRGFLNLQDQVDKHLNKLTDYYVLSSLDRETQMQFVKLYQLLKLWELNRTSKEMPSSDVVRALKSAFTIDKATTILREYYNALRHSLFDKSLYFKNHSIELQMPVNQSLMLDLIKSCEIESRLLESTIGHYREFLLIANSDPYVKSRIGFSKWLVGPEPHQTKPLLKLGHDAEYLGKLFQKLENSLTDIPTTYSRQDQLEREIDQDIYDLGHPLASYAISNQQAGKLIKKVEEVNELGSMDIRTIGYMGDVLAKMLRSDWRHNALFNFTEFHDVYDIHHHITKPAKNRQHITRINKFQRITKQILDWVQNHKSGARAHDIELDINDMKVYLQDFLAYIQRHLLDFNMTKDRAYALQVEISQELLECRYLFGNFFHHLKQYGSEGSFIRNQCLFVDGYLEAIEQRLYDLQHASWPETVHKNEPETPTEEDE